LMKRIAFCVLLMTVSAAVWAAEDKIVVAHVDKDLLFRQKPAAFAPIVTEKYEYYEVYGSCDRDSQCRMRRKGISWSDGKKYDSTTNWHVTWKYGHNRTPEACSADSFRVFVDITFLYPKWGPGEDTPRDLVDKWEAYIKNLVTHENGHRDLAVEAATELSRAVAELPPSPTCADVDREVRALSRMRMDMLNDDEKEYDTATNHGYTQGAMFR
jgi:predicted secreted Zn-dependent protease